jgi:hypothetical protein
MGQPTRRTILVQDSIESVLRRADSLPATPEADALRAKARAYLAQADSWGHTKPTAQEREKLMKEVLGLHVLVAKLERPGG